MACNVVTVPGGGRAIVCGIRKRQLCACGNPATLLCDWKIPGAKTATCDTPICTRCATAPAVGKDLCRVHAKAFAEWQAARRVSAGSAGSC